MSASSGTVPQVDPGSSPAPRSPSSHSVVAVAMTRPLVGYLQGLARELTEGDFEALVVWCEVAHGSIAHLLPAGADAAALLGCIAGLTTEPELARPVVLRDLAAVTGIPRETVRRKLERLATQGHLRRQDGGWVVCPDRLPSPAP